MQLSELKAAPEGSQKRGMKRAHGQNMSKKDLIAQQRDYKKKKSQKKAQRRKDLEEEREQDKAKWQLFNAKLTSKGAKGQMKKSIFASPEANSGKVGVGTCGVGGKPMTSYHQNEKWKKGAMH